MQGALLHDREDKPLQYQSEPAEPWKSRELSPEKKEVLGAWRIVCSVGLIGSVLGMASDVAFVPVAYASLVVAIRGLYAIYLTAMIVLSFRRAEWVLRNNSALLIGTVFSLYVYLTWLDVISGDFAYSGYYRSMIQVSLSLLVFRHLPVLWQGVTVLGGFLLYATTISLAYDVNMFAQTEQAQEFLYILWDVGIIYLILFLVFRRYARFQQDELRLREALRRANEIKSDIIAKVNHELQTPLLGILANLDNMHRWLRKRDLSRVRRAIDKSRNYCMYQRTLVNNMITAAASETREAFFVDQDDSASLQACYKQALGLVNDIHDGEIEAARAPAVYVPCQQEILMIVLVNLLANCAEHSSYTRLHWSVEGGKAVMRSENQTLTPINVDAIFEPWTTTRKDKTKPILGLGLNIARRLIQKIGGDIQAREDQRTFYLEIKLPICGPQQP